MYFTNFEGLSIVESLGVKIVERKKVLFFIYRLGGGGAARTILNIVNYLDRNKFEPILVTLNFTYDYEQYVKEDVKFIKLNTKRLRSAIVPLAKLIRKERPDLLFSTIPNYNTVTILAKILSFTKTKLIVREAAFLGGTFKEDIKLKMYGFLYRFAQRVVALSYGVKENLVKRYGVDKEKIKVIYNPVDLNNIRRQANEPIPTQLNNLYDDNEKRVIVSAGRLVKEKDQQTLIKAFAKVQEKIDSTLIILGEGELENELKQLAEKLLIEDKVHFVGFQKNPYTFFKHADLFVLTSISEGFGHVFVEAMATGTPIVSTRCKPGAEEVLENGKYGMIANVGDVADVAEKILISLQMNEEERTSVIQKGFERAEQFDVSTIVNQYEELFLATIGKGKTRTIEN